MLRSLRFIHEIPPLKAQMDAFVGSGLRLGSILVPLLFVMLFYTIVGTHLFSGVTENRCRLTPEPVNGEWEAELEIRNLCGVWECPDT